MFGEIRSLVSSGDTNHICAILTVKSPDSSALGWSKDYFQKHFSGQRKRLGEIEQDVNKGTVKAVSKVDPTRLSNANKRVLGNEHMERR
jgi:hypothetical protein